MTMKKGLCSSLLVVMLMAVAVFILIIPAAADALPAPDPGDNYIEAQTGHWEPGTVYYLAGTSSGFSPSTTLTFKAVHRGSQEEFALGIVDHHYDWEDCSSRVAYCANKNWWATLDLSNIPVGNYYLVVIKSWPGSVDDIYPELSMVPECDTGGVCIGGT